VVEQKPEGKLNERGGEGVGRLAEMEAKSEMSERVRERFDREVEIGA
jgi:hypothetical protein